MLEEVEFKTGSPWANPYTLQLKDNSCTVIWTVSGLTAGTNQIINVDLSTGSGTSRSLTNGQKYSFGITGSGHNIRMQSNTNPYSGGGRIGAFDNNCNEDANDDLWFRVGIGQSLPVELIEFRSNPLNRSIELLWKTGIELNISGFEIQKSRNGKDWQVIEFIDGQGATNETNDYIYKDLNPYSGLNYYRLKQIDFDGTFEYSKVITINFSKEKELQFYPNPVNDLLELKVTNLEFAQVIIMDKLGREVQKSLYNGRPIDVSNLLSGMYLIGIITDRQKLIYQFIKK